MKPIQICITVEPNDTLHDAYIEALRADKAGSVPGDQEDCDRLLADAENRKYDPGKLAELILTRAGAGFLVCGEGTHDNPIRASDWE